MACISALITHASSVAQPQVLAEIGPTQPIAVMKAYNSALNAVQQPQRTPARTPVRPDIPAAPFQSQVLSPGFLRQPATLKTAVPQAMAWVGDDARSLTWLARHAPTFAQQRIPVLLVSWQDTEALARLRQQYPALAITALDADVLANTLGVARYPVLISQQAAQQ